jgi:hypothetical protein
MDSDDGHTYMVVPGPDEEVDVIEPPFDNDDDQLTPSG